MRKVLMTLMSAWGAAALLGQPVFAQPQNDQARTLAESVEQAIMTNPNIGAMYKDFHSALEGQDRKSTRLNSSHVAISYAVFCLKKKKKQSTNTVKCTNYQKKEKQ